MKVREIIAFMTARAERFRNSMYSGQKLDKFELGYRLGVTHAYENAVALLTNRKSFDGGLDIEPERTAAREQLS